MLIRKRDIHHSGGRSPRLFFPARATRAPGETPMKRLVRWLDWVNQWWLVQWLNQWWLLAPVYVCCAAWWLDHFFPSSGMSELRLLAFHIWKAAIMLTAVVQGTLWLWRQRRAHG
jgi:hypothetical protein